MQNSKIQQEVDRGVNISIINLVDLLLADAEDKGVSDIHVDPTSKGVRVRYRVDGVLDEAYMFPTALHSEIVTRIKVLAGLRTDEHQTTQDGRFRHAFSDEKLIDVRVSVVPTYHGENAVMRLLSDHAVSFSLETMGFSQEDRQNIARAIKKPNGMILATGPTGSGKTTTLYTLVRMLNHKDVSVVTIEDPIEYAIDNVEQIQVNSRTGVTFANGLRAILRQDPNIIMVGEIRDAETASIAVNSALTGHLLLSTLHTNDAVTAIPRLLDMKIEPFLIASTLSVAIAQRLVRRICEKCKDEITITDAFIKSLEGVPAASSLQEGQKFFKGKGCTECRGDGYNGRLCVNEVLVTSEKLQEAILRKASSAELKEIAVKNGMTTMIEDGLKKAAAGETTLEEIFRVIYD